MNHAPLRRLAWAFTLFAAPLPALGQTGATLTATPASLAFSLQIGGAAPAEQKVQIKRGGSGAALDFSVTVPAGAPWLIVTPTTGKTGTAIGVRVNPTSLLAGTYTAVIQIDAVGAASPVLVNVSLTIKNPPPVPTALPASLAFHFQTDQAAPSAQTVTVSSSGEPVSFTVAVSGGTWLSVDPGVGISVTGAPTTVTVAVDTTGLVPGNYSGKVTFSFSNAATKTLTVPLVLSVTPGTAVIDSIWPNSAPLGSNDATITIRGRHLFQSSAVQAGTTSLTATWVSTAVLLALVPKTLMLAAGPLAVTVTNAPQAASSAATFTVTPPGPVVQAVVNGASFAAAGSTPVIAPGEIISIFGSGLGPATMVQAVPTGGAFPTSVGTPDTHVEFELTAGTWTVTPIIFAQANQINAVAPFAMTPATGLRLRVTYNGLTSAPFTFDGVEADPGLFTTDSSGRGQAAALNYSESSKTYSLNSASNAALKGSIVAFYATGGGATTPAPSAEGQIVPLTGTLPQLNGAVSVTIGGDGAAVQSATLVPGSLAGLVQLNVTVPSSIKAGKDLPVVVTIAGRSSAATATLSVK